MPNHKLMFQIIKIQQKISIIKISKNKGKMVRRIRKVVEIKDI